jgi:hypothetical protein
MPKGEVNMLPFAELQTIGREACIDALGRDFFEQYRQYSAMGGGNHRGMLISYVAVSDKPLPTDGTERKWTRLARCKVNPHTGEVYDLEVERHDVDN